MLPIVQELEFPAVFLLVVADSDSNVYLRIGLPAGKHEGERMHLLQVGTHGVDPLLSDSVWCGGSVHAVCVQGEIFRSEEHWKSLAAGLATGSSDWRRVGPGSARW